MNIKSIEKILTDASIEPNEAKIEVRMLIKHFLGLSEKDLMMQKNPDEINPQKEDLDKLLIAAERRAELRIPIQHIIGTAHFMGEDFIVNQNVLIPRDETELLVLKSVKKINLIKKLISEGKWEPQEESKLIGAQKKPATTKILDIGTGSGCIACMVAKLTDSQVLGIDISSKALETALDNSTKLGLFNKVSFRKSDLFLNIRPDEKFDCIISNPPYIPIWEEKNLAPEVKFDPYSALFTNDESGIEFYLKIILNAHKHLIDGGYVLFELGINQAEAVQKFFIEHGFENIEIEKDLAGINRVICAQLHCVRP